MSDVSKSASLEFLVHRDNCGDYYREIVGGSGKSLARCPSFASQDDAARGAQCVYESASSPRFDPHAAEVRQLAAV